MYKEPVPLESAITKKIIAALNALPGTRAQKIHGSAYSSGWPDVLVVKNGLTIFIEVKRPGREATPAQASVLRKWSEVGAVVGVAHSVEEALEIWHSCGHIQPVRITEFPIKRGAK